MGIWMDKSLKLKHHTDYLAEKLKLTLGFLYRLKPCFSMTSRKRSVAGFFLSQIDLGGIIYSLATLATFPNVTLCITQP